MLQEAAYYRVSMQGTGLKKVDKFKYLGMTLAEDRNFNEERRTQSPVRAEKLEKEVKGVE